MDTSLLWSLSVGDAGVLQTPERRREELARDLAAAGYRPDRSGWDGFGCVTKPTVLRRLASLLAERVSGVDRIAAPYGAAAMVATALCLETGTAFAVLTQAEVLGELHPGERVLLVEDAVEEPRTREALAVLRKAEASPVGVLAVVGEAHAGDLAGEGPLRYEALFSAAELSARPSTPDHHATGIREGGQG